MTTVSSVQGNGNYGIDTAVTQGINVSDATQMENNFITLMVAQIQNQDPTSPVDSTEFLNQFSAMSQVKSLENMADLSKSNLVLQDNLQMLTAAGLVGQEVKVEVDSVALASDSVNSHFVLEHASPNTTLTLTDSNGIATEIALGYRAPGDVNYAIDPVALGLAPGTYAVSVSSDNGEYPALEVSGTVTSVRVSSEGPVLDVTGTGSVPFYKITEFGAPATSGLL